MLEVEEELVDREEGLLQEVKDFSSSREEAEASLVVEQARGSRGFLRLKDESSESESEGEGEPRPSAPYVLRFLSERVKSRVGGEEGVRGCSGRGSNFGGGVVGSVLGSLLPFRLRRFWNCVVEGKEKDVYKVSIVPTTSAYYSFSSGSEHFWITEKFILSSLLTREAVFSVSYALCPQLFIIALGFDDHRHCSRTRVNTRSKRESR